MLLILVIVILGALSLYLWSGQEGAAGGATESTPGDDPPAGPAQPEIIITPAPGGSGSVTYQIGGGTTNFPSPVVGKLNSIAFGDLEAFKAKVTIAESTPVVDVDEMRMHFANGKVLHGYRVAGEVGSKDRVSWVLQDGTSFKLLKPVDRGLNPRQWRSDLEGPVIAKADGVGIELVVKDPSNANNQLTFTDLEKIHSIEIQTN
jgi:hypothetical protein